MSDLIGKAQVFDWITPLSGFLREVFGGETLMSASLVGWDGSANQLCDELRSRGIPVSAVQVNSDRTIVMFNVPRDKEEYANAILGKLGRL